MMIPFLAVMYKKQYVFRKHIDSFYEIGNYNEVCLYLLKKSKLRGTLLLLPNDVLIGDEAVKNLDRVYEKFDPEARDEGVEYEGEKTKNSKPNNPRGGIAATISNLCNGITEVTSRFDASRSDASRFGAVTYLQLCNCQMFS
jgi:hypothetical protein